MPLRSPRWIRVIAGGAALALAAGCSLLDGSDDAGGKSGSPVAPVASAGAPTPGAPSPTAPPRPPAVPGTVTIAFGGDVHFSERTEARLAAGPETALGPLHETFARADFAMVNLESAITERGTAEEKLYHFRTPASSLDALAASGVDVVGMANNHAVDYGPVGLQDSLEAARTSALPVIGIGTDTAAAFRPWIAEANGVKVAFVAASQVQDLTNAKYAAGPRKPGIASALTATRLVQAVKEAKAAADVVVVYMHWGIEGQKCPSAEQKTLAQKLADAGAAAVVGTHAHVMQGAGMLGKTYVGYGFGNFLWYGTSPYPDSDDTGVTTLTITHGKVVGEEFTPAFIDGRGVPVPQTGAEAERITRRRDSLRPCTGLTAPPA
ncbi:CapA family protein [Yinghuangia sp. ASG 101]|uniref:CapA family protein n=1 Tax=Yinghuangia sp. ASG 101 TaxID=2896848 RepID=UPI001E54D51D|nr:CapA family protein [Yinghuangia sp. ASG 101]UGQ14956.1 CapA family protein [Yinghuangia sp. ASG 101]